MKTIEQEDYIELIIDKDIDNEWLSIIQNGKSIDMDKQGAKQLIEVLKEWVVVSEFKKGLGVLLKPTDSEIIEMLRLKILENPSFTTLFIPKGLLSVIPKEIQGLEIIESDLAEAGRIYFANTGRVK